METKSILDQSNSISVSIGLHYLKERYKTGQKAIQYDGNRIFGLLWSVWKENGIMFKHFFSKMKALSRLVFEANLNDKELYNKNE